MARLNKLANLANLYWSELVRLLLTTHIVYPDKVFQVSEITPINRTTKPNFTAEELLWAVTSVWTRGVYVETPYSKWEKDIYAMAPLLDYLNHGLVEDHGWLIDSDDDEFTSNQISIKPSYVVHAGVGFNVGDEVMFQYGPHSNEELLYHYGFTLEHNIYSRLPLKELDDAEEFLLKNGNNVEITQAKLGLLRANGIGGLNPPPERYALPDSQYAATTLSLLTLIAYRRHYLDNDGLSWHTTVLLRVCWTTSSTKPNLWSRALEDIPINADSENLMKEQWKKMLTSMLHQLSPNEEDLALLEKPGMPYRKRLALNYRVEARKIIIQELERQERREK